MEEPDSPVLSCKKAVKRHNDLTSSPVLSSKRQTRCAVDSAASPVLSSNKRKKLHHPGSSPVISRSCHRPKQEENSSPEIDNFSSPARRAILARDQQALRPKSLFPDIEAPSSQDSGDTSSPSQHCQVIEDSLSDDETSDDNPSILEKTFSDEEVRISDATRSSSSNNSLSITQGSSFLSLLCTPPKKSQKKSTSLSSCSGSSRKKNLLLPNGMAKQLSRLITRQETDYRLWKFQHKLNPASAEDTRGKTLAVRLVSATAGQVHCFAHCKLVSGDACTDDVCLVFTNDRWEKFNLQAGDVVSINEPWQSVLLRERQVTLVLGFNLIRKRLVGEELLNRWPGIEDAAAAAATAPRRPCSSPSAAADNVAVAENKRPSSVAVVLQTWTCPSQGGIAIRIDRVMNAAVESQHHAAGN